MTDLHIDHLAAAFRRAGGDGDLFRQALHCASEPVVIAAVAPGVSHSPIAYVNPAFEAMTGYGADEAVGQDCRFLQREDRLQPGTRVIRAAIDRGERCCVELRNYRKDGALFRVELRLAPIHGPDGQVWSYIGIQRRVA